MFNSIGVYVREKNFPAIDVKILDSLLSALVKLQPEIFIEKDLGYTNKCCKELSHDDFITKVDLIIVFGGDGTLLNSSRKYINSNIPILGINMGKVGFLTDINIKNFDNAIKEILDGSYEVEKRNLVKATFEDKNLYGLNEITIHSGSYAQLMLYRLTVNRKIVYEQRSDGLIIATPTGSTAYALSAGGPIIHPKLDVWTILPMLPQSLSSRPFVISSNEEIFIEILDGPNEVARICADGQDDVPVKYDTKIFIEKLDKNLNLVHPKSNDFFEACREKLGWSLDISQNHKL